MARQRTSPYLPGVEIRLWRFIPARRLAAGSRAARLTPRRSEDHASTAAAPVVALIRRLPLLFDE